MLMPSSPCCAARRSRLEPRFSTRRTNCAKMGNVGHRSRWQTPLTIRTRSRLQYAGSSLSLLPLSDHARPSGPATRVRISEVGYCDFGSRWLAHPKLAKRARLRVAVLLLT